MTDRDHDDRCFICRSLRECAHREPELVEYRCNEAQRASPAIPETPKAVTGHNPAPITLKSRFRAVSADRNWWWNGAEWKHRRRA